MSLTPTLKTKTQTHTKHTTTTQLERARQLVRGREVAVAEGLPQVAAGAGAEAATRFFKVMPAELQVGTMEDAVACRIATRDCG